MYMGVILICMNDRSAWRNQVIKMQMKLNLW